MLASKTVAFLFGFLLLLLIARHEYIWFVTFQAPKIFRDQRGAYEKLTECNSISCYRYYGPKTAAYLIESWPNVDFNTGEFYSGSIATSTSNPNRTLFFIFKPASVGLINEVVIWLNGGPGCSSLYGFTSENGPISWTTDPIATVPAHKKNPFAWSESTNMIWVDQPVGTGFSDGGEIGPVDILEMAREFADFFENWQRLFGIMEHKIYLTGESFAGRWIPYIAAEMLDRKNTSYFDLSGALLYSPTISVREIEDLFPRYEFAVANNDILHINQTALDELRDIHSTCGYAGYLDKYLQYPPQDSQPPAEKVDRLTKCDIVLPFRTAARDANPCYNVYHIMDGCPSRSQQVDDFFTEYFNRDDVKTAIHAPRNVEWRPCSPGVRMDKDKKPLPPIQSVLPRLIESTGRVLISNGDLDGVVLWNGTLLAIQNMSWNGKLGFQERPSRDFVLQTMDGHESEGRQEVKGIQHYERGLQWVGTYNAGHEQPMYQPRATLKHLQWLRGEFEVL